MSVSASVLSQCLMVKDELKDEEWTVYLIKGNAILFQYERGD